MSFRVVIKNNFDGDGDRTYYAFSELPDVSGGITPADVFRTACFIPNASLARYGQLSFSYRNEIFGFIGQIRDPGESRNVDPSIRQRRFIELNRSLPVTTGSTQIFGTTLKASVKKNKDNKVALDIYAGAKEDNSNERVEDGAFAIKCLNTVESERFVVGLALRFNGEDPRPVAAVKYRQGFTYQFRPKFRICVACDLSNPGLEEGEIIRSLPSAFAQIKFPSIGREAVVYEESSGLFSGDVENSSQPQNSSGPFTHPSSGFSNPPPDRAPNRQHQSQTSEPGPHQSESCSEDDEEPDWRPQDIAFQMLSKFNTEELADYWSVETITDISSQAEGWYESVRKIDGLGVEVMEGLLLLALYDCVLLLGKHGILFNSSSFVLSKPRPLADDSYSMRRDEKGKRIVEMKKICQKIVSVNRILRDATGVQAEFLNHPGFHVKSPEELDTIFKKADFHGYTQLGTKLKEKILDPKIYNLKDKEIKDKKIKPLIIIIITDGKPEGEKRGVLKKVLKDCKSYLDNCKDARGKRIYGNKTVTFQISQVGNDEDAQTFLHELDHDKELQGVIDCTSNKKLEAGRGARGKLPLLEEERVIKMLVGALDIEVRPRELLLYKRRELIDIQSFEKYHKEDWSSVKV
ncbi:MAG: hypothetical protein M1836_004114 [Candelina mexicana]|nr:MAG: hypothetical protein M1836_004114 [Candelina mexicana]